MSTYPGNWHGRTRYFGLHYDLHANARDTELGVRANPKVLVPALKRLGADFVQTDCKGHPGYTSWFSRVPDASVSPGVKKDALKGWRAATRQLDLPLHCHYSGIWDAAAGEKHPDWGIVDADGNPRGAAIGADGTPGPPQRMCPRSPYLEKLLIPQLIELIDRYGVDGFWMDGDIWAVEPCYCARCRKAFAEETRLPEPPRATDDPNWHAWFQFTMKSFEDYVTRYCDAVHAHKPGVLVCSNWLQTFGHPGRPHVPTDWISGDNTWIFGLDKCRCETRFISTRGKPWDIMIWTFYSSHGMGRPDSPWTFKPVQMLQQEAAVVCALGGNVQLYENAGLRNGQLVDWRIDRLRHVGRFVKARRTLCQGTGTVPQVVVIHSEHHARRNAGENLRRSIDTRPVEGAVYGLLENHLGVDILDEWALESRLDTFPVAVAPEQGDMSGAMVKRLKAYVQAGGRLLVSGADGYDRFGPTFLGVTRGKVVENATYHVSAGTGSLPVHSARWRLLKAAAARPVGHLGTSPLLDERLLPNPAATLNRVGRGAVAYVPFDCFRFYEHNRYPLLRAFIGEVARRLGGTQACRVRAPASVDVVYRQKGERLVVHLINRASGIPNSPHNGAVDDIPPVGPVSVTLKVERKPEKVALAFERHDLDWRYRKARRGGTLEVTVSRVHIHSAVVIDR